MNRLRLEIIATRVAWAPPPTESGESMTLLEYAGPLGPNDKIIEQNGKKYVIREPLQDSAKSFQW